VDSKEFIDNFKANTGRLPSQVELSKSLKISPQTAIKLLVEASGIKSSVQAHVRKRITHVSALKIGLFIVSGFTFILSVYFTSLWFRSMFSPIIAGLISVSMVTYMVLSPQVSRYITGAVKAPVYISFVIAMVFSMGSTVAGQYGKLTENIDMVVVEDRSIYEMLLKEEAELQNKLEILQSEKDFHMETLRNLSVTAEDRMENYSYIGTERRKVEEYNTSITEQEKVLQEIRNSLREEIQAGNTGIIAEEDDFFTWISGILHADRQMVQFWVYTLPAVFIDVIAALCLNLALYIKPSHK
jgi:hypothetical protein